MSRRYPSLEGEGEREGVSLVLTASLGGRIIYAVPVSVPFPLSIRVASKFTLYLFVAHAMGMTNF